MNAKKRAVDGWLFLGIESFLSEEYEYTKLWPIERVIGVCFRVFCWTIASFIITLLVLKGTLWGVFTLLLMWVLFVDELLEHVFFCLFLWQPFCKSRSSCVVVRLFGKIGARKNPNRLFSPSVRSFPLFTVRHNSKKMNTKQREETERARQRQIFTGERWFVDTSVNNQYAILGNWHRGLFFILLALLFLAPDAQWTRPRLRVLSFSDPLGPTARTLAHVQNDMRLLLYMIAWRMELFGTNVWMFLHEFLWTRWSTSTSPTWKRSCTVRCNEILRLDQTCWKRVCRCGP